MNKFTLLISTSLISAIGCLFCPNSVSHGQEKTITNHSRHDLWLVTGQSIDRSVLGLGDRGYDDPNPRMISKGWIKIPAGHSIRTTSNYVFVAMVRDGRPIESVPLEMKLQRELRMLEPTNAYFGVSRQRFECNVRGSTSMPNTTIHNIRNRGLAAFPFYRIGDYASTEFAIGVHRDSKRAIDLFHR